jgi:hypothetical protein
MSIAADFRVAVSDALSGGEQAEVAAISNPAARISRQEQKPVRHIDSPFRLKLETDRTQYRFFARSLRMPSP